MTAIDSGHFRVCHVLLHKDGAVPWFILILETASSGDLLNCRNRERDMAVGNNVLGRYADELAGPMGQSRRSERLLSSA